MGGAQRVLYGVLSTKVVTASPAERAWSKVSEMLLPWRPLPADHFRTRRNAEMAYCMAPQNFWPGRRAQRLSNAEDPRMP
jgi:hypothetical protein